MIEHQKALKAVNTYLSCLVNSDYQTIVSLYSDNATVEDPVGSDILRGGDAIKAFYEHAVTAVTEAKLTGDIRVSGDEVAFPFEITADLGSGSIKIQIIDIFRFDSEGKVDSMRAFWGQSNMQM